MLSHTAKTVIKNIGRRNYQVCRFNFKAINNVPLRITKQNTESEIWLRSLPANQIESFVTEQKNGINVTKLGLAKTRNLAGFSQSLAAEMNLNPKIVPEKLRKTYILGPGDRDQNDDYFPLGEEFDEEIGMDIGQLQKNVTKNYIKGHDSPEEHSENEN